MKSKKIHLVYFSPTGTTKTTLTHMAEGTGIGAVTHHDLTLPAGGTGLPVSIKNDLTIFGIPVYSGRVPPTATERIRRFRGENTPAVVVAVYGNREFEDALLELRDAVTAAGFVPFAGGAFLGEHSFSNEKTPIAHGRPDAEDAKKAREFGKQVRERLESAGNPAEITAVDVPGNYPYKEIRAKRALSPETMVEVCTTCGTCAAVCPTGAVTVTDKVLTDADSCILCSACVKRCPTGARVLDNPDILKVALWLHTDYCARKEPEFF